MCVGETVDEGTCVRVVSGTVREISPGSGARWVAGRSSDHVLLRDGAAGCVSHDWWMTIIKINAIKVRASPVTSAVNTVGLTAQSSRIVHSAQSMSGMSSRACK